MAQNFLACDREQAYLMPPSLRDWLAGDQLAWCVLDAVAELDLSAFYGDYRADGHGRAAYDPAMMVALSLYAYAVGERSSRAIERRCVVDVAFRVIAANQTPDHATIARFRVRHQDALAGLFGQVLGLCARAGLVSLGVIALDSTKLQANASGLANRTYEQIAAEILAEADAVDAAEDERFGERRGDELPAELADPVSRKARLREAKRRMDEEHRAARQAHQEQLAARAEREARLGRRLGGRKPKPPPEQVDRQARINVTDLDSRSVRTARGFIQGYNAHAVTTSRQIIIAAELEPGGADQGRLEPMIGAALDQLQAAGISEQIQVAVADAGYWSGEQIQALWADGIQALVPPDGQSDGKHGNPRRRGGIYDHMRRVLASEHGKRLYRHRAQTIEPIFGHTKHNRRADRFQRRGLAACRSEWRLITATHNLLKYWRATTTAPAAA
jgi:transposase